ncbi:unnamed protein product [Phaeothamnion confervicola]
MPAYGRDVDSLLLLRRVFAAWRGLVGVSAKEALPPQELEPQLSLTGEEYAFLRKEVLFGLWRAGASQRIASPARSLKESKAAAPPASHVFRRVLREPNHRFLRLRYPSSGDAVDSAGNWPPAASPATAPQRRKRSRRKRRGGRAAAQDEDDDLWMRSLRHDVPSRFTAESPRGAGARSRRAHPRDACHPCFCAEPPATLEAISAAAISLAASAGAGAIASTEAVGAVATAAAAARDAAVQRRLLCYEALGQQHSEALQEAKRTLAVACRTRRRFYNVAALQRPWRGRDTATVYNGSLLAVLPLPAVAH